jgi:hypothetical protein
MKRARFYSQVFSILILWAMWWESRKCQFYFIFFSWDFRVLDFSIFFSLLFVLVSMWLTVFCLTKSLLCNVVILSGMLFISESSFQKCASRSSKKILCKFKVKEVGSQASVWTTQYNVWTLISQQHSSGRRGNTVWTPISVHKFWTIQGCIHPDVLATCTDVHQCSIRNQISFTDTDIGRQLHPFGRQVYTVQTLSLIRQDVEKNCNRPDVRATPSGHQSYYRNYVQ